MSQVSGKKAVDKHLTEEKHLDRMDANSMDADRMDADRMDAEGTIASPEKPDIPAKIYSPIAPNQTCLEPLAHKFGEIDSNGLETIENTENTGKIELDSAILEAQHSIQPAFSDRPNFSQPSFSEALAASDPPQTALQALATSPEISPEARPEIRPEISPEISPAEPTALPPTTWVRFFSPEVKYTLGLFVSTRIVLTLIGLASHALLPLGYGKQMSWASPWLDLWGVWDSLWYMDIAQNGYSTLPKLPDFPAQTNFPFFPLYPLLMKILGDLLGGQYFWAGLIVSNACLLASCYLLYQLTAIQWGKKTALRSVKYLFLFPVSFILSGVFTESLFLCLSLLCFYWAKQRRWWLAGVCGAFLSATRVLGVLIALPLLFEYGQSIQFKSQKIRLNSLFVALIPLGLLAFCLYNYQITGDFLFFKTNQAAWDRELLNPLVAFWQALMEGIGEPSFKKLLECSFFVAALALLSAYYKTIGFAYWLLGMYSIFIPLSAGVDSMPRFTLPIFPIFIALAVLSRKTAWNRWMTLGFGFLQGALMVLWCTGQGLVI